jgi:arsenical pump membrane protein
MHAAVAAVIFSATLVTIVARPRGITEAWAASAGAVMMLVTASVTPASALQAVASEWNLLLFFLGLMLTAAVADMAGFFDWAADVAVVSARGSGRRLLFNVLVLGALVTTFLSNDATAVILTPIVYAIATRLRLSVMPYLFAVAFMANSASMTLPISNPINILVGDRLGPSLLDYASHLLLASLAAIAITIVVFMVMFRRTTETSFDSEAARKGIRGSRRFFTMTLTGLAVLALAYMIGAATLVPLGLIATAGGLALVGIAAINRCLSRDRLRSHLTPSLFVYIAALFILVRAVEDAGITAALMSNLVSRATDAGTAVAVALLGSGLLSNAVNNLPAVLIFVSGVQAGGVPPTLQDPFLFGSLAGADLGPNLAPVGALSTMLWLAIVRRRGVEVSAWDFMRIGLVVAPLTLLAALLLIALSYRAP